MLSSGTPIFTKYRGTLICVRLLAVLRPTVMGFYVWGSVRAEFVLLKIRVLLGGMVKNTYRLLRMLPGVFQETSNAGVVFRSPRVVVLTVFVHVASSKGI